MNIVKYCLISFALALFTISCNNGTSDHDGHENENTEMQSESHEGHDHPESATTGEKDKSGPEYTSAYVCPMHCEGSGSAEAGKCPVCGMNYVLNEDKK